MTFDLERARPPTLAGLAVALALLMPTGVLAQSSSRTFYDASGRVSGHSTTDSGGLDHDLRRKRARHWPHVHKRQPDDDL